MIEKLITGERVASSVEQLKAAHLAMRLVLVTGCFDIIHRGHVALLEHAFNVYDDAFVVVGLNSDASVRRLKGEARPINDLESRAAVMAAMEVVWAVFEIDSDRVDGAIRMIRPAAWVKGGDYTLESLDQGEVQAARDVGAEIVIFHRVGDYSTTNILKKAGLI